ncbi:peptidase S8/S53 domain-containing protein [Xylaria scruposa]|nr:peptidase S8/S53 domain-containing protein [Xylaria scruposa]
MPGAEDEASALDAYHLETNDAKQLIEQNLVDKGMDKWDSALRAVEPYISSERLNVFKHELDNFQKRRYETSRCHDTDSDGSEGMEGTEDSSNEGSDDIQDDDAFATGGDYEAEHRKLVKRHTMRPHMNTRMTLNRSSTVSALDRRATLQNSSASPKNDTHQYRTFRGDRESTMAPSSDERMPIYESTTGTAVDISNSSTQPKNEDQGTPRSAPLRSPSLSTGALSSKENNSWFSSLQSIAHNFVYGKKREFWPSRPVKVAILDSGFALSGTARQAMKPYLSRIKSYKTFTNEIPNPNNPQERLAALDDLVGHGTTVAYQLTKTCPSADIYIAKVTIAESADKKATLDKGAVARAIRHAATPVTDGGWGVDVINMSFGWDESELPWTVAAVNGVSGAIEFADKKGVLLFAAASNYGLTELNDVFYPARDPRVISVDAEDGLGNPASFALRSVTGRGDFRYCAPGLSVESPVSAVPMCGSSFACPVAAGVAALVLEFVRHENLSLSKSDSVKSALGSSRGMLKVFGLMSQQAASHPGFGMLYPWHFLKPGQREKVALDIIGQLEIEFGKGKVGHEIKHSMEWQSVLDNA